MTEGNGHVIDPNGDARRTLQEAVAEHGPEVLSNAAILAAICQDQLTGLPGESILIGDAARTNVPALLDELIPRLGNYGAIQSAATTLAGEHNLDMAASLWVVREFARALGYIAAGSATGTSAAFPGSGPRPAPGSGVTAGSGVSGVTGVSGGSETAEASRETGRGDSAGAEASPGRAAPSGAAAGAAAAGAAAYGGAGSGGEASLGGAEVSHESATGSAASGSGTSGSDTPGSGSSQGGASGSGARGSSTGASGTGASMGATGTSGADTGGETVMGPLASGIGAAARGSATGQATGGETAAGGSGPGDGRASGSGPGPESGGTGWESGGPPGTGSPGSAPVAGGYPGGAPAQGGYQSGAPAQGGYQGGGSAGGGSQGGGSWGRVPEGSLPEGEPGFPLPLPAAKLPGRQARRSKVVNRNTIGIAAAIALVAGYLGVAAVAHLSPFPAAAAPPSPSQSSSPLASTGSSPASSPHSPAVQTPSSQPDILMSKIPAAVRNQNNQTSCQNAGTQFGASAVSQCQKLQGLGAGLIIYYLYPSRSALDNGLSAFLRKQKFTKARECSTNGIFTDFLVECQSDFTIKSPGVTGSVAEYTSTTQNPIIVSTDNEQEVMAVMIGTNDGDLLAYWKRLGWVVTP